MKALPMQQPWATLVVRGVKTTETRDRHTSHRGPVAVLATKTTAPYAAAPEAWARLAGLLDVRLASLLADVGIRGERLMQRGGVIGVVSIVDSVEAKRLHWRGGVIGGWNGYTLDERQRELGDFGPGRRVWLLDDAHACSELVPCRGMPGMFDLDDATTASVVSQLRAEALHG